MSNFGPDMNDDKASIPRRTRVRIVIPTYEPQFEGGEELESFYRTNFDSYLDPDGDFDWSLVLTDFKSSLRFKSFLREYAAARPDRVVLLDGKQYLSATQAINMAMMFDCAYVRGDIRIGKYFKPKNKYYIKLFDEKKIERIQKNNKKKRFSFIEDICEPDGWEPTTFTKHTKDKTVKHISE